MFFVLFDNPHNPNVIAQVKVQAQVDSSERAWMKRRKPKRSDNWSNACYSLSLHAVRRLLLLMSDGRMLVWIPQIRALGRVQGVIPSEEVR